MGGSPKWKRDGGTNPMGVPKKEEIAGEAWCLRIYLGEKGSEGGIETYRAWGSY